MFFEFNLTFFFNLKTYLKGKTITGTFGSSAMGLLTHQPLLFVL